MNKYISLLFSFLLLFSCSSPTSTHSTDSQDNTSQDQSDFDYKLRWKKCSISENIIDLDWTSIKDADFYRIYYIGKNTDTTTIEEIKQNNEYIDSDKATSEISLVISEPGHAFFYITAIDANGNEIQQIEEYRSVNYDTSFDWDLDNSLQNKSECILKWTRSAGANLYFLFAYACEENYTPTRDEIIDEGQEFDLTSESYTYQIEEINKRYYFLIASCYDNGEDLEDSKIILYENTHLITAAPVTQEDLYSFKWDTIRLDDKMYFNWTKSQVADHYIAYCTRGDISMLDDFSKNYKNYSRVYCEKEYKGISMKLTEYNKFYFCVVTAFDKDENELYTLSPTYYYVPEPIPEPKPQSQHQSSKIGTITGFNLYWANKYTDQLEAKWKSYPGASKYILYINDTSYPYSFSADTEITLAGKHKQETTNTIEFFYLLDEYCHCIVQAFDANGKLIAQSRVMTATTYKPNRFL